MARELNYNILSERMAYYLRYATRKKSVMLGFSLLQLVTSEHEGVDVPEAQLKKSLPSPFHVPATGHSIANRHPASTRLILPLVLVMMHPSNFVRIPPLFHHVVDADTDPDTPTASSWLIKCMASLTMH
jgi:hypothetical protein